MSQQLFTCCYILCENEEDMHTVSLQSQSHQPQHWNDWQVKWITLILSSVFCRDPSWQPVMRTAVPDVSGRNLLRNGSRNTTKSPNMLTEPPAAPPLPPFWCQTKDTPRGPVAMPLLWWHLLNVSHVVSSLNLFIRTTMTVWKFNQVSVLVKMVDPQFFTQLHTNG